MGYESCRLCGRMCDVDRTSGVRGICREGNALKIASAGLHRGEEPPISGENGSGTVFLSGCGLRCSFCQNHQISCGTAGREVSIQEAADMFLAIQSAGATNINFVTGTHFAPSIAESINAAKSRGLSIPIVWNSSGYDMPETIALIRPFIDIYLPDCKTLDPVLADRYLHAPDYPDVAKQAIELMVDYGRGTAIGRGEFTAGTIVRHLVLPGHIDATRDVLSWFSSTIGNRALLSLLVQFDDPGYGAESPTGHVTQSEYRQIMDMLDEFNIDDGFIQDLGDQFDWIPDFNERDPFPEGFYTPVWHWAD